MLTLPALLVLAQVCAADADPATLLSVVAVESGADPWAIGVNGPGPRSFRPASRQDAVDLAHALLAKGRNIDLGLGQINSRNLARLGLSVEDAFEPCRNLAAARQILDVGADVSTPAGGATWRAALSRYNTGRPVLGEHNGYVAKVAREAARLTPRLRQLAPVSAEAGSAAPHPPPGPDFVIYPTPFTAPGGQP